MLQINCSGKQAIDCNDTGGPLTPEYFYHFCLAMSVIGLSLNLLSLFIFVFSNNMNTRFLRYLKFYLVNSLMITVNHCALFALFASIQGHVHKIYSFNLMPDYSYMFYYNYVFLPIWIVSYTYGNLLDILIAYERILMYLPHLQFMRNVKIYSALVAILLISCLINLPFNFSRGIERITFVWNSNETLALYFLDNRIFYYNDLFKACIFK